MSYYRDTLSAVVRCLSAETIDNTSKQAWQKLYDAGYPETRSGSGLSAEEQRDMDCLLHARLHRQLSALDWAVLVAKYSTHKARKVDAIGALFSRVESPAPQLFRSKAITAWAIPELRGADGRRSTDMIVLPKAFYCMNGWDLDGRPERTRQRWRAELNRKLEGLVTEALKRVEVVLILEGVLAHEAA